MMAFNKFKLILKIVFICCLSLSNGKKEKLNKPLVVCIKKTNNTFKLNINNKEFFVKGAGGNSNYKKLKSIGGNSIRTWSATGAKKILDSALANGLTVTLGIEMALERQGFNYSDKKKVKEQFERIKKEIYMFKDHPALLMWGIGNELELSSNNPDIWNAVEEIANFIHKADHNHPTTTMLAGVPKNHITEIIKRCPSLDILSINAFKDIPYINEKLLKAGWTGPYMITEWGPDGYWESEKTFWGAFIEATSTKKAELYRERYQNYIKNTERCLGSYVFYWGYKQERTHTVFSMFLENNSETESVYAMEQMWQGISRKNTAPKIKPIQVDKKNNVLNLILEPSTYHHLSASAVDPDGDKIKYTWEIYFESKEQKAGGDKEIKPPQLNCCFSQKNTSQTEFVTPTIEGPYRIFVYAYDNHGNVATANWPLLVKNQKNTFENKPVQNK